MIRQHLRGGDDDFGVNKLLVKLGVLTLLVRGGDERVTLLLDPLSQSELVLSGTEKLWLLFGVDAALYGTVSELALRREGKGKRKKKKTYIVEDQQDFTLSVCSSRQRTCPLRRDQRTKGGGIAPRREGEGGQKR